MLGFQHIWFTQAWGLSVGFPMWQETRYQWDTSPTLNYLHRNRQTEGTSQVDPTLGLQKQEGALPLSTEKKGKPDCIRIKGACESIIWDFSMPPLFPRNNTETFMFINKLQALSGHCSSLLTRLCWLLPRQVPPYLPS